jgi:hypothetical protein
MWWAGLIDSRIRRNIVMKVQSKIVSGLAVLLAVSLAVPVVAQEKKAEEKKVEKAKAEKVSGDIGLLDTEKNYMIVVTKEGKLVTLDYTQKTKVTELKEKDVKMADVGLGSSATVEYTTKGEKNFLTKMQFIAAKGE